MKKRYLLALLAFVLIGALVLSMTACSKKEAKYPSKSIELVIPYAAGGSSDITARMFASFLKKYLDTTINVTNIGGSGTVEGMTYAYNQPSDGYTIMSTTNSLLMKQAQGASKIIFTDAFNPICNMCGDVQMMLVRNDSPFKTFDDLIAYAKENPGKVTVSGISAGGGDEFGTRQLEKVMGVDLMYVPYSSTSEAKAAVLGKECDILNDKVVSAASLVKSGDMRPLITISRKPVTSIDWLSGIPSYGDYNIVSPEIFRGMAVKADVPQKIQDILIDACNKVAQDPEWQAWLKEQNLNVIIPEKDVAVLKKCYIEEKDAYIEFYKEIGTIK